MVLIKNLNLLLRLLLELCVLLSIGYWGFQLKRTWIIKFAAGLGLPIIVMAFWTVFIAPDSTYELSQPVRTIMELVVFALGAYALYASRHPVLAKVFSFTVFINMILLLYWKQ